MMMMTKKSNNNGRIPKLEKELNNRIVELTEEQEIKALALERWKGLTDQEPAMVDSFTLKKEKIE